MIPVRIVSRVEIPTIKEEVIAELIKAEILRTNPELTITDVTFERKINPTRIAASITAELTGSTPLETVEELETTSVKNTETLTKDEPIVIVEIPEKSTETVSDIFGED